MDSETTPQGDLVNEGFFPMYTREISVRMGASDDEEAPERTVTFIILVQQEGDSLKKVRLQLRAESRLDFLFETEIDEETFNHIKGEQDYEFDFVDFPNILRRVIGDTLKARAAESDENKIDISLEANEEEDGDFTFLITQALDFCDTELFHFDFQRIEQQRLVAITRQRYQEVSDKLKNLQTEYRDMCKKAQRQWPDLVKTIKLQETAYGK